MTPPRFHRPPSFRPFCLPILALGLALPGCEKPKIDYYEVPSEDHAESALMRMQKPKDGPPAPPTVPMPSWSVPESWAQQEPGSMQRALFTVSEDGQTAEISVSAFPGDAGGVLANVNRWRGQLDLEPVDEAGLEELLQPVPLGAAGGILTEMTREDQALIAALASHEGMAWFFKLAGPAPLVASQREAFLGFLRSVNF